jgi:hypothetical protein
VGFGYKGSTPGSDCYLRLALFNGNGCLSMVHLELLASCLVT